MKIDEVLRSSRVQRCHILPTLQDYSVGLHIMRSLVMADFVYDHAVPNNVFRHILHHDAHELYMGDVPWPSKRALNIDSHFDKMETEINVELGIHTPLSSEHRAVVKVIDMLEFLYFLREERTLGNQNNSDNYHNAAAYVELMLPEIEHPHRQKLDQLWEMVK